MDPAAKRPGSVALLVGLVLLVRSISGCSTGGDPATLLNPESPEATFKKLEDALHNASTVKLEFALNVLDQSGQSILGQFGTLVLKRGNKASVTFKDYDGTAIYFVKSDGVKMCQHSPGATQCEWFDVPGELTTNLEDALLRGTYPGQLSLVSLVRASGKAAGGWEGWKDRRAISGLTFGEDPEGHKTISYILAEGGKGYPPLDVCLWYDPKSFALVKAASGQQRGENRWAVTLQNFTSNTDLSEDLFKLPPEDLDPGRIKRTRSELATLRSALDLYAIDNNGYPTTQQGLEALLREPTNPQPRKWKGPYLKSSDSLKDPWGNPYFYRSPRAGISPQGFDLSSWGPDGKPGTRDDIER
jgi:type II secretion system protein G